MPSGFKTSFKNNAAMFALSVAFISVPSYAQDATDPPENEAEEIIVTGSRIARPELELANPIVAVDAKVIENSGQANVTDILIRNPALTSSLGGSLSGGVDAGLGETGANLLDLRNLGTQRTLVLVNGKRHVAGIADTASVDINSIPQDLIEKVDILTGGASAVYGADGVSGVVNFVLKRNFQGLTSRGQVGLSSKGDAGTRFFSVVGGKNFASDKGNIAIAYEFSDQDRLTSFARDYAGDPQKNFGLFFDPAEFANDDPNRPDRILYNNVTWLDSAPDGAVDLDLDFVPDFTGSGRVYDSGIALPSSGGRAVGGSNTPVAGYFGDLLPSNQRHAVNLLSSYEISPALRLSLEGKFVQTKSFSVGQPSFDFYTFLAPDNAFLNDRFGVANTADGAYLTRDNFDFGQRGETIRRRTYRGVAALEGDISDNAKFELSYVYGRTKTKGSLTSNIVADRYWAALDAVRDPSTGRIVCRSTLNPADPIDPVNFGRAATTFSPGANSSCRPLNLLGNGVASQESLDFILAKTSNTSSIEQNVASAYVSGDFDSVFELPGGSLGFALGAEYRKEASRNTPDALISSGSVRDFAPVSASGGKFNVKEVFGELNAPLLRDQPLVHLLSFSAAIRLSDYSTIGNTETWKIDGVYAPIRDIRFRGTYSKAVRAPNIDELFSPESGGFNFVTDPCDRTRLNDGKPTRTANCAALLGALGLSPTQIANFSPSTNAIATTSRRGTSSGNLDLKAETARTWTAGVVVQPRFIPRLTMTFDWYDIRLKGAINTASATQVAENCVDGPDINNVFCASIFRDPTTGFVLGDSNDVQERIGYRVRPENVANFKTSGADFRINYNFEPSANLGKITLDLVGGYLKSVSFVSSPGADTDVDTLEQYNPRWRGSFDLGWNINNFNVNYTMNYWSKTRRYTTEELAANPDRTDPKFFFFKEKMEHDIRFAVDVAEEKFQLYGGVNNFLNQKPAFDSLSYPVSGVGRFFYVGAKVKM